MGETEDVEQEVESDGERISFENLVSSILGFVYTLVQTPRFRSTVTGVTKQVIYHTILFMQITREQVSTWTSSPYRLAEDESEDSCSYSVRGSAQDLLVVCHLFLKNFSFGTIVFENSVDELISNHNLT